ncbi:MAG: ribosomal subunit interface protein [Bacteroidetes bacterium HGW-Bacteroidetes-21]|jgi:putative sigma-54 modulation protein|nr:MAG: ribosomal subunit interface protein [Bacteroidetes bacterium HGW-Bacteroidetes-21]
MNIKIHTLHFNADKKLEDLIESKVGKIIQRNEDVISADVTLRLEKSQDMDNKVAEIKIEIPGNDLYARKQSKSFEEAADIAVEAIRRQLKKYKEKKKGL